jgi:hypothetical protein
MNKRNRTSLNFWCFLATFTELIPPFIFQEPGQGYISAISLDVARSESSSFSNDVNQREVKEFVINIGKFVAAMAAAAMLLLDKLSETAQCSGS